MKAKFIIGLIVVLALVGSYFFFISEDVRKMKTDLVADSIGLNRTITHCIGNNDCKTWTGKFKVFPFPGSATKAGGGGSSFQFFYKGDKVICGPGWRIIEN